MKHPLIVQMHPDGVFVFLSLLIYGGLFSTQNKNLHFNFHYLYLPPQCFSPGRQLVLCSPSAAPHCTSIGEDTGAGAAQVLLYRNKLTLLRSPVRYVCLCPARTLDMFGSISHPFLHVVTGKAAGLVSCLVPNTSSHLVTCSPRNSSQQKKNLDMLRLVSAGDSSPCLLHSCRGGRRMSRKPSLEDSSLPCFLQGCPCSDNTSLQADSYPKITWNIANVLVTGVEQGSKSCSPS